MQLVESLDLRLCFQEHWGFENPLSFHPLLALGFCALVEEDDSAAESAVGLLASEGLPDLF